MTDSYMGGFKAALIMTLTWLETHSESLKRNKILSLSANKLLCKLLRHFLDNAEDFAKYGDTFEVHITPDKKFV